MFLSSFYPKIANKFPSHISHKLEPYNAQPHECVSGIFQEKYEEGGKAK